jgi:hypothetical protein
LQISASTTQRHIALSIIHYTEEIQTITSGAHSEPNGFGFGCGCILSCMIIHSTSVHFCRLITEPPETSTLTTPGIFATTLRHAAHQYPTLFLQASRSPNHAYLAESALCWSKAACVLNIQPQIQVRLAAEGCIRVIPELRVIEAKAEVRESCSYLSAAEGSLA